MYLGDLIYSRKGMRSQDFVNQDKQKIYKESDSFVVVMKFMKVNGAKG